MQSMSHNQVEIFNFNKTEVNSTQEETLFY